jgi:hypothetical protein
VNLLVKGCVLFACIALMLILHGVSRADASSGSSSITLELNRTEVYYLGRLPGPDADVLLWFDWTVRTSTPESEGSIQFSHDGRVWSNLVLIVTSQGVANGRQPIDSSWATPGQNFLRATIGPAFSQMVSFTVFVNYEVQILQWVFPILAGFALVLPLYFVRRVHRRKSKNTL